MLHTKKKLHSYPQVVGNSQHFYSTGEVPEQTRVSEERFGTFPNHLKGFWFGGTNKKHCMT